MDENILHRMNSSAHSPDLDWSQVRETVRMLNLSVAQIEMAMREGDDSIGTLTDSFTSMIAHVNSISRLASDLPGDADGHVEIERECDMIRGQMQESIVAFQFYDKLTQRLRHVSQTLGALSDLVDDQGRLYNPEEWHKLQDMIRSGYTMAEELAMFDAVLSGVGVEQALMLHQETGHHKTSNDVELF